MKSAHKTKQLEKPIKSPNLFPVVGIGASAGGLDAFKKLLKVIPDDSGMAYVLVQHLDPTHESMLPELLQKVTSVPVLEITDDIKVQPNHIYVIPSNKMMVATDGVLLLTPRPSKSKTDRNLPIDLFFTSLAEVHQSHAIGVVLSGTGTDGTKGKGEALCRCAHGCVSNFWKWGWAAPCKKIWVANFASVVALVMGRP